jgi:hypothetical protein
LFTKQKVVKLTLPQLHPRQAEFVHDKARFVVAACGSKTGKTFGLVEWLALKAWNNYQSMNWWTAPTYRQSQIAFDLMGKMLPRERIRASKTDRRYELLRTNGDVHSVIEFRSADNPESLRGEGVNNCVIDEAGYWNYDSYVSVMTTLTRTRGNLRIISTPKGRNWFYDVWMKGWHENPDLRKANPEYSSYRLPTSCNPHIPRESLIEFQRSMPHDVYRQEILAEFLEDGAGVFRNIAAAFEDCWQARPIPGQQYVLGIDWAKHEDYTVFSLAHRATKKIVHVQRLQGVDWNINIRNAIQLARGWNNALIIMDSTGVGDVPFDQIRGSYASVMGYSISTNASKMALIQKMQFAFERGEIKMPSKTDPSSLAKVIRREIELYGYEISTSGKLLYSAPDGQHDDYVISAALANWALSEDVQVYRARQVRI